MFADDCVLHRKVTNINDSHDLHIDIDKISTWCLKWQFNINICKCRQTRVTKNSNVPTTQYSFLSLDLGIATSYKYLGIYNTHTLTWKENITRTKQNA